MEINVAYSISEENFYMAMVSIYSLFANNQNNNINLYIIYDGTVRQEFISKFDIIKKYDNCSSLYCAKINHIKYTSFCHYYNSLYCLELPKITDADKILYINSASIVNGDLSELYGTDVSNCLCASTKYIYELSYPIKSKNKFLFSNYLLLMNLKELRERKLDEKLLSRSFLQGENIDIRCCQEMHFLNLLIDNCKELPMKYGYAEKWHYKTNINCSEELRTQYKKYLLHTEKPVIIVFVGAKPIEKNCCNGYKDLWWKYAEKTSVYDEIKDFQEVNQYKLKATTAINSFNYKWLLSRMFPYIKPYWFRILIGFMISVPLGLLDGVTALALKPYMDYVIGGKTFGFSLLGHDITITSLAMAFILPVGIILFAAFQGVLRYLNSYISAWTSRKITNDVKFDLFHRLVNMHPQFFDDNPSGIIISRYVSDASTASSGVVSDIKAITTSVFGALGLIAVMIYSSWQLAFIGVLVLCVAFVPVALLRKRIRKASNENMVISGNITTNMNETYNGNKVMFAYDLQDRQENLFRQYVKEAFNINMSLTKRTAWMSPMMYQIASVGIAIVLGYGTYLINTGQMTAGSFASFVTSLLLLYKPIKSLGSTLTGIQKIFVAMGRVFELFDLEPAIQEKANPQICRGLNTAITFENVYFEYVPNKPVLKNINLTVPKNETLAIVGNSGGGKSTLVNLVNRFYDVKEGAVKYDGTDIREFSLRSLRRSISMVFQDNFLYSGTIRENILMGKPDATNEELEIAIKYAHLEKTIEEFPEGLDTVIGERGLTLSGGQRQRIAIARAMLRNAPIVILDEATSALDNESEAIVQKAMDNLMKNRTVFIIAHRLSTIKNADRIAVINEGELVELGTHDELMNIENGQYKHLYEMQFKKQEKVLGTV
ncbi:MAG: ATP-binding cassette domain-containing protein [bacterium]|nr:ATP-binding cassette domain-containing protein [bacterium]